MVGGPALWSKPEAFETYRSSFRPSAQQAEPYLVISADILIADTAADARALALPEAWSMALSRSLGAFPPLMPASEVPDHMTRKQAEQVQGALAASIHGTEEAVIARLTRLVGKTGADEVMSTASTFDTDALYASDTRLAEAWQRA